MVDLFITPSIIQQFYLNPDWGLRAYYSTITGAKIPDNYFTRTGRYLHNKHGYNNKLRFYGTKVIEIDGEEYTLAMEGTPDHINPLKELKTCGKNKVGKDLDEIIQAAGLQLMGYMFLTGEEYGYVVVMERVDQVELVEVMFQRNDELFFDWVARFFKYLWSQPNLENFMNRGDEDAGV